MSQRGEARATRNQSDSGGSEDDTVSALLSASLSPGLEAALADVDMIFGSAGLGDSDHPPYTAAVHKWVRDRVVAEYAGEALPEKDRVVTDG